MDLRGYIVILKKDGAPGPFCDWRADKCVFGSDPSCDVNINLTNIGPVHCTLQALQDGRVMAESHVKPTSRTLLNGEPVVSRTFVPHNSTLTVGERNFKFLYPENSTWTSTFRQSPRSTKADTRFRSATTPVVDVESFPVVRSKSPKPSVPQPFLKRTPTASPSRRPLTTRERYGPTPPRPITPAPVVEVKRHESRSALKARRSSAGSQHTPTSPSLSRKKAHVLLLTNTSTSGPQSIRRHARQQKTPASTQANNSSITSSYSVLDLKSPNYSNESAYTTAFLNDPSYDASYNPSSADVLSPAAEYFSLQKKGDFAPYAEFPFTEPRQRTFANRTPISRRKSLPRSRPMLPTKGSDSSTPIPTRSRSSSSPASSLVSTPARNLATLPAPSPNNAASFRLHRSPNSIPASPRPSRTSVLSTNEASLVNMPRVASPSPRGTAKTPLTEKSRVRARSIVSSTKVSKSQREVSLGGGERRSLSLGRPSLVSASKDSSEGDVNVNQIPKSKSKAVKFGPALSPEQFDSRLPPSTPVRRGAVPLMHSFRGRTSVVSSHPQHNGGPTEVANSDVSISSSPAYVSGKRLSTQRQSTTTNNMPSSLETRRSLSAPPSVVQFKSPARSKDIATPSSPWTGNRKSTLPVSSPVHQRRSVLPLGETHIKTDLPMSPNVKSNLRTSGVNKSQDSLRELSAYDLVSPTQTLTESPRALLPERNSGLRTPAQHVPKRLSASSSLKRTSNPDAGRESVSTAKLPRLSGRRAVRASPTPRKPLRASSPAASEPRVSGKLSEVSRVRKSQERLISPSPASPDDILMSQTPRTLPRTGRRSKLAMKSKSRRSSSVSDLLDSDTGREMSQLSVFSPEESNLSHLGVLKVLSGSRTSRESSHMSTTKRRSETPKSIRSNASVESTPLNLAEETLKSPTPRKYSRSSVGSRKSNALRTPENSGPKGANAGPEGDHQGRVTELDVLESPVLSDAVDILFSPTPRKSNRPSAKGMKPNALVAVNSVQKGVRKSPLSAASLISLRMSTNSIRKKQESPRLLALNVAPDTRLSSIGRRSKTNTSIRFGRPSMVAESTSLTHFEDRPRLSLREPAHAAGPSRRSGRLLDKSVTPKSVSRTPMGSFDMSVFPKQPTPASSRKTSRVHATAQQPAPTTSPFSPTSDLTVDSKTPMTIGSQPPSALSSVRKSPLTRRTRKSQPYTRVTRHVRTPMSERRPGMSNTEMLRKTRKSRHTSSLSGVNEVLKFSLGSRISRASLALDVAKTPGHPSSPSLVFAKEVGRAQHPTPAAAALIRKTPRSVRSRPLSWLASNQKPLGPQTPKQMSRVSVSPNPVTTADSQFSPDTLKVAKTPTSKMSPRVLIARGRLGEPKSQPSPRLTGVRKLLKTPTAKRTPRLSAVRKLVKTPESQPSPQIAGVRELLRTPAPKRTPRMSAVRKLVKTPESQPSPRMAGVRELLRTPAPKRTPRMSAVRKLVKTPESQPSPQMAGVRELLRTPAAKRTPRLSAVRKLVRTPESQPSPQIAGVRELLRTPAAKRTPRLSAVRKLVKTPQSQPLLQSTNSQVARTQTPKWTPRLSDIRRFVKTPKSQPSPPLTGVRRLLKTPASKRTPRLSAVPKLIKTPGPQLSPQAADVQEPLRTPKLTPRMSAVRRLVKTPKSRPSPRLTGVRKLMKTPTQSPRTSAVRRLVRTPKSRPSPLLAGVRGLLKTPRSHLSPQLAGVRELMKTPRLLHSPRLSGVRKLVETPLTARSHLSVNLIEAAESRRSHQVVSPKQSVKSLKRRATPSAKENMSAENTLRPRMRRGRGRPVQTYSAVQSPKSPALKKGRSPAKSTTLKRTPGRPKGSVRSRKASKTTPKGSALRSTKTPTALSSHSSPSNSVTLASIRRGRMHPSKRVNKTPAQSVSTPLIKAEPKPVRLTRGSRTTVKSLEETAKAPVYETVAMGPPTKNAPRKRAIRGKTAGIAVVASPTANSHEGSADSGAKPKNTGKRTAPKRGVSGKKKAVPVKKTPGTSTSEPVVVSPLAGKTTSRRVLRVEPMSSPVVNSSKKSANRRAVRKQPVRRKLPQSPDQLAKIDSPARRAIPKRTTSRRKAQSPGANSSVVKAGDSTRSRARVIPSLVADLDDTENKLPQRQLSQRKRDLRLQPQNDAQEESVAKANKKVRMLQSKTSHEPAKLNSPNSTTPRTPHTTGTRKRRLLKPSNVEEASPAKCPKKISGRRAAMSKATAAITTKKSSGSLRQPPKVGRSKVAASSEVVTPISTRRTRSQKD